MFELDLLDARKGDAIIVRHGTGAAVFVGLIDGGPPDRFEAAVEPGLARLSIEASGTLGLDWLAISHIDDDHIGGIEKLLTTNIEIGAVFFNTPAQFPSLNGAVASVSEARLVEFEELLGERLTLPVAEVTIASIGQGHRVVGMVGGRGIPLNPDEHRRLIAKDVVDAEGLTLAVVGPTQQRLDKLVEDWEDEFPDDAAAVTAEAKKMDTSVPNLSSLTFLASFEGGTVLFTGDALEDDLLAGLEAINFDFADTIDVLKLPHHGSNSAANPERVAADEGLLERVSADNYIISADGQHGNPSHSVLDRLVQANLTRPCTVWFASAEREDNSVSALVYSDAIEHLRTKIAQTGAPIEVRTNEGDGLTIVVR